MSTQNEEINEAAAVLKEELKTSPELKQYMTEAKEFLTNVERKKLKKFQEMADHDQFTINGKVYHRKKLTFGQEMELEQLRNNWDNLETKDKKVAAKAYAQIYVKSAEYYLGISATELNSCRWEEVRDIVDGCAWRTRFGSFL